MERFLLHEKYLPRQFRNVILDDCNQDDTESYIVRSNVNSLSDIDEWVRTFSMNSDTAWNTRNSFPEGKKFVCWKKFECHHSQFNKVPRLESKNTVSKNAQCPAKLNAKVKLKTAKTIRTDPYCKDGLCAVIHISKCHSHKLFTAQSLRYLNSNLRDVFVEYFNDGMTVAEAKAYHESLLFQSNHTSEVDVIKALKNPTTNTVQYWFSSWRKANLEPRTGPSLIAKLKEKRSIYRKTGTTIVFEENPFSILILTPIMKRSHSLPMASQLVFSDSSDDAHHSITFLLTPCAAGAAPLGVLITEGQSVESFSSAFSMLRMNYKKAFGNAGHPKLFLTDNGAAKIEGLRSVWPESKNLFCIFHILQAVWRWIWDAKHKIRKQHRIELMDSFKKVLYAKNISLLKGAYKECIECGNKYQYKQWANYVNSCYWPVKEKWALAYRDALMRDDHINNFTESSIRIIKDIVLSRVKAYNIVSVIDVCCTVLEHTCISKFRDFVNFQSQDSYLFFKNTLTTTEYLQKADITELSPSSLYLVPCENEGNNSYTVDITVGFCSCTKGRSGKMCKHQRAVFQNFTVAAAYFPAVTEDDRFSIAKLTIGEKLLDINDTDHPQDTNSSRFHEEFVGSDTKETLPDVTIRLTETKNGPDVKNMLNSVCSTFKDKVLQYKSSKTFTSLQLYQDRIEKIDSEYSLENFLLSELIK